MPADNTRTAALLVGLLALAVGGGLHADEPADEFGFFDYLGTMVEDEGEWLDPLSMDAELQTNGAVAPEQETPEVMTTAAPQGEDDE